MFQFSPIAMATPYNPTQQSYQPPGQTPYPPQVAYGYPPPQDQIASAPYPPPTVQGYPPQGYPPQIHDLPPAYPTLEQGPPPAYVYKPDQPAYGYQPQLAKATIVVDVQPMKATTTRVSPPRENHSRMAVCSLVFSICTLLTCGAFFICLLFSIPALILSITALRTRGRSQRYNAGFSIVLNIAVIVWTVVLVISVVTPFTVSTNTHSL